LAKAKAKAKAMAEALPNSRSFVAAVTLIEESLMTDADFDYGPGPEIGVNWGRGVL
jgi:hypothetical protein